MDKIKCPYCGYEMPLQASKDAVCRGIFARCKGRGCKRIFEVKVNCNNDKTTK